MTKALQLAFREASKLPETEQDALAEAIWREVSGDEWDQSFSSSSQALEEMANEAIVEHHAGRTPPLRFGKRRGQAG